MSIRIEVVGGAQGKHQLDQVAKGVYGIRDAELAAARAIREREQAQKRSTSAGVNIARGAFKAVGPLGQAGGVANAILGSVGMLGPFSAAITAASGVVRNLVVAEQAHLERILETNEALREFKEGVRDDRTKLGSAALGRLLALPDDQKARLRKSGSARGQALVAAESIQKEIQTAEDSNLSYGIANLRGQLAASRSPETARLVAWNSEHQTGLNKMRLTADNTGPISRIGQRFGQIMGNSTSELEYEKAVQKFSSAAEMQLQAAREMSAAFSRAAGGSGGGL
jgi:hypothetical protein